MTTEPAATTTKSAHPFTGEGPGPWAIPPGWRWAHLDQVTVAPHSVDPRRSGGDTFQYVDISSINTTYKVITEPVDTPNATAPSRARQVIRAGDVLVSGTRPNLNAVALVPPELDGAICSTGFSVLRPSSDIDSEWLFAFVRTQTFIDAVTEMVVGLLYPAVTDRQLRSISIPLPPLPEQRRIAAILRDQLNAVRRARESALARVEAARALPAAFLRSVFESEEAKSWSRVRLGEVADVAYGLTKDPRRTEGPNQVPYLRVANVQDGWVDTSDMLTLHLDPSEYPDLLLRPGDILFAEGNSKALVGRCALWDARIDPCSHQNHILRARLRNGTESRSFVYLFARSPAGQSYFLSIAKQTTGIATMNSKQLRNLEVPWPDGATRHSVTLRLESFLASAGGAQTRAEAQLAAIDPLPQSLLRRAFAGEL